MINSTYYVSLRLMSHADELAEQAAAALMEGDRDCARAILARHAETIELMQRAVAQCEREAKIAALTN